MMKCFFSSATKELISKLLDSMLAGADLTSALAASDIAAAAAAVKSEDDCDDGDKNGDGTIVSSDKSNSMTNSNDIGISDDPHNDAANFRALCEELRTLYL